LDISEQLLLNGLAVVYRQGGAQYDGNKSRWEELEEKAVKVKLLFHATLTLLDYYVI
jgi:hypothetical protein